MSFNFYDNLQVDIKKPYREYNTYRYQVAGIKPVAGICAGSALQWASDVLGEIAGNTNVVGFTIPNKSRFYDVSGLNQKAMEYMFSRDPTNSMQQIVDILNRQGKRLNKVSKYRIDYSLIDGLSAEKKVNLMLGGDKKYKNSAFILTAILNKKYSDKPHQYSHAVAVLNYEGKLFLFDASRGICKLPGYGAISCNTLLSSVAEFFGIDKYFIPFYRLNTSNAHIFMKLQTSKKTNKHIVTREVFPSSEA